MSDNVRAIVSLYGGGRLQQGYTLYGDRVVVKLKAHSFTMTIEIQDNADEGRAEASVKVCGHTIFDTEDHTLKAPDVVVIDSLTALGEEVRANVLTEQTVPYAALKEARASVELDGQTQSVQEK